MIHDENVLTDVNGRFLMKSYFSVAETRENSFRTHHHAACELSAILKGRGIYRVNGKAYGFSGGDVFLFAGDEMHCISDIYEECEILNIHFVPRLLWADGDLCLSRIFFARSDKYENKIDPQNPMTKELFIIISEIENELSVKRDGYRSSAKYKLLYAITGIVRNYGYVDTSVSYKNYKGIIGPLETALSYIDANIEQSITLTQISEAAAISPTYLSAVFKKLNGISLWEYITAKRVERAIELLKTTDETKLEIAMKCGFNSSSNFYKAFFKVTGKTPKEYTKQY